MDYAICWKSQIYKETSDVFHLHESMKHQKGNQKAIFFR
jgi:hypothetical protein